MTTGVVVGSIFLSRDELLRVEELAVGTSADLIYHSGLEIDKDGTGNVLSGTSFSEEGAEAIFSLSSGLVGKGSVGLDSVLEAVEFPAGVSDLTIFGRKKKR